MSLKQLSRYRECQDCKKKFIVHPVSLVYEQRYKNPIFCPRCNSNNIALISIEQYNS